MASEKITNLVEEVKGLSVLELSELVKAIEEAYADYDCLTKKAKEFSDKLFLDATRAGGEKYAEICELAYRQAIAALRDMLS